MPVVGCLLHPENHTLRGSKSTNIAKELLLEGASTFNWTSISIEVAELLRSAIACDRDRLTNRN